MTSTSHRRSAPPARLAALAAALLIALSAGCGSAGEPTQEQTVDAQADLTSRATLEETIARYEQMQQRIRDRLDAELGPFTWFQADDGSRRGCGRNFPNHPGGRVRSLPLWGFEGNIPDQNWPRAQYIVADVTGEYGFVTAGVQIDTPGRHLTSGVDTTLGAYYRFGTDVNTSVGVTTGCHLPADAANAG